MPLLLLLTSTLTIIRLLLAESTNEFAVSNIEFINLTTVEVNWKLDKELAKSSSGFHLKICNENRMSERTSTYSVSDRSAIIYNIPIECRKFELLATFHNSKPILIHIFIQGSLVLNSKENDLIGCFMEPCTENLVPLFNSSMRILGLCYGESLNEIVMITSTFLQFYNIRSLHSKMISHKISDQINLLTYDWLNKLVLVFTRYKIYQINTKDNIVTYMDIPEHYLILDGVIDPLNGWIHVLLTSNKIHYYMPLPLIIINGSRLTLRLQSQIIPDACSMLLDQNGYSLKILQKSSVSTYFFENSSLNKDFILKNGNFHFPDKFQRNNNGYLVWNNQTMYEFSNSDKFVHSTEDSMDHYINSYSINRDIPIPLIPFIIKDSLFGNDFLSISWIQPRANWQSDTSWEGFVYTLQLQLNGMIINTVQSSKRTYQFKNLKNNSKYGLTLSIGLFQKSIHGVTSNTKIQDEIVYYVIRNGNIQPMKLENRILKISKFSSFLNNFQNVKDLRMFQNIGFILFKNGSIAKISNKTITDMLTIKRATKIEIDHESGNIFYIDSINNWLYRYRFDTYKKYTVDCIIATNILDFAIFPLFNVLVYLNESGNFFTDLNGFPKKYSNMLKTDIKTFNCDDNFGKIIEINNSRRILIAPTNITIFRCIATDIGTVLSTNTSLYLQNWEGNSSVNLVDNQTGTTSISFMEQKNCKEVFLPVLNAEMVTMKRSKFDEIILSMEPIKNLSNIQYFLDINNVQTNEEKQFILQTNTIDIRNYTICNDLIIVSIKYVLRSTYGDSIKVPFRVPCTTDSPRITDIFFNKRINEHTRTMIIEMQIIFLINANSQTIDSKYPCDILVDFKEKLKIYFIQKIFKKYQISCLDKVITRSFEIDKRYEFQINEICISLRFANLTTEKCVGNNVLKTSEREIFLPFHQKYIFTYMNEKFIKLSIDTDGKSVVLMNNAKLSKRRILISQDGLIDKIEIDWRNNTLFWSEKIGKELKLFSAKLNTNKENLRDDRILWFADNNINLTWTILSIERKLQINRHQIPFIFNIDFGPGWNTDHFILSKCKKLIEDMSTMKCETGNQRETDRMISSYFSLNKQIIIYENFSIPVCQIVSVQRNYVFPHPVGRCAATHYRFNGNFERYAMIINNKTIIDDDGGVYNENISTNNICILSSTQFFTSIQLKCYRKSAEIDINLASKSVSINLSISYENTNTKKYTNIALLNNILDNSQGNTIYVNDLLPGILYKFHFKMNSKTSNSSFEICQCSTESDVPDMPVNVSIIRLNFTHSLITWEPGQANGEFINNYTVIARLKNSQFKYVVMTPKIELAVNDKNGNISVTARNTIGISLPNFIVLKPLETRKQIYHYYLHSTMTFSTSLFLIIILILVSFVLIISMYVHHRKIKRHAKLRKPICEINEQTFEMLNANQNIKYEINSLYGFEKLPLSNFDKIPHILNECLSYSHLIGNGAFGVVFKGTMRIESDNSKITNKPVALKIRNGKSISEDDFKREAVLLFKYFHPNIIELFGVSFDCPDKQCLILEYMEKGNLRQYLQHHRPEILRQKLKNNQKKKFINENSVLDIKDLINISADILEALKYLEEKNFVHRDIAARNCLVSYQNKNRRITKLGDFGLARDIYSDEYYRKASETKLPIRWMAPETIKDGIFSGKSDVWSFGVLCWEIMTFGADPYMGQVNAEVVKDVIDGKHLNRPENCPIEYYEMMLQCWKYYPECRPSFLEIDLLFQYFDEIKDIEETSTLSRLIIRSYNSSHESEFGRNSDPVTEKTSITFSEKYPEVVSLPMKHEEIPVKQNYDNLGYEVPLSPATLVKQDSVFLSYSNEIQYDPDQK